MRIRPLLAVLAVIALVAAPTAGATTKKKAVKVYCHLVSDKTSDGQSDGYPFITSDNLDVVGADMKTDAKTMTAKMTLADSDYSFNHDKWASTFGYSFDFSFNSNYGQSFKFSATVKGGLSGALSGDATIDNSGVALKSFKLDPKTHTFTWIMDRSVDKTLTRKKTVFKEFRAHSHANGGSADEAPDQLPPPTTYPDLAPSCVKA